MSEIPPVTNLVMGTDVITAFIPRVEIREGYKTHSMAIIDVMASAGKTAYPELTTVALDYGRSPGDLVRWNGYVHHSNVMSDGSSKTIVTRYVCIGTTLRMNLQKTRSWKNVTASSIARQIGRENGLRTVISPSSRLLSYWAQQGESDFKLVQDLAKEVGFEVWVEGTTLYFMDPTILLLDQTSQNIPVFTMDQQTGRQDTLTAFSILTGTMIPRASGTTGMTTISGIDAKTGRVIKASSTPNLPTAPFLNTVKTSRAVTNYVDAQAIADASTLNTRSWITMQATVYGTARIAPGTLVGIGGTAISTENQGRWLISGTKHLINKDPSNKGLLFTTTVDAERDQQYAVTFKSDAGKRFSFTSVPAVLRSGYWESTILEDINVN